MAEAFFVRLCARRKVSGRRSEGKNRMVGGEQFRWLLIALTAALIAGCATSPQLRDGRTAGQASTAATQGADGSAVGTAGAVAPVVWEEPAPLPSASTN